MEMTARTSLKDNTDTIVVNAPLKIKRRSGRKEVILAEEPSGDTHVHFRLAHQEALVIAIARAHRWQKLLDEGKFASISDLAREIGLDVSFAALSPPTHAPCSGYRGNDPRGGGAGRGVAY